MMYGRKAFLFLFLLILFAGCSLPNPNLSEGEEKPSTPENILLNIECTAAYRQSVSQPVERTETVEISKEKERQEIAFTDLVFHTWYSDPSPHELRSLKVFVTTKDSPDELSSVLYQFSGSEALENQIVGHSFTGLHYVYHPISRSELQFWCSAK